MREMREKTYHIVETDEILNEEDETMRRELTVPEPGLPIPPEGEIMYRKNSKNLKDNNRPKV